MDSSMEKIDTADGRKRLNENSGAGVPRKKVKDAHHSVDPGAEGKGKGKNVVVSDSDSTGDVPLKKSIHLGNIATTGPLMVHVWIKQEFPEEYDSWEEARKKIKKFLIVPADYAISKKGIEDDSNKKLNDLKIKDCTVGYVLGPERKVEYVIVSDSDSTGESHELKTLGNLGNVTGSSMDLERQDSGPKNQDISRLVDSLEELVGKMKRMIDFRKEMNESSKQQNLPEVCSKKETDGSTKMSNELKTEHPKTLEHINPVLGVGSGLEDDDDVNRQSADETAIAGKGKDAVVSEESQGLKKQADDHDVNDDVGKTRESDPSDHVRID